MANLVLVTEPEGVEQALIDLGGVDKTLGIRAIAPMRLKIDEAGSYKPDGVTIAVSGSARWSWRIDGGAWSTGDIVVAEAITSTGIPIDFGVLPLVGDANLTVLDLTLSIPQNGIIPLSGDTISLASDVGVGSDSLLMYTLVPMSLIDLGEGIDGVTIVDGADAFATVLLSDDLGVGSDAFSLLTLAPILSTDAGVGSDSLAMSYLLVPPALSSMTAGDGSFTVTVGTVTGATNYDLRYKLTSGSTWTEVHDVGSGTQTVSGLTNASQYDVQARTVNASGDGPWGATTTVTPAASAIFEEVWSSLSTAVWDIAQLDSNGASSSASVVSSKLRLSVSTGEEYSETYANIVVKTDNAVVDGSATKRVTFAAVPSNENMTGVVFGLVRSTQTQNVPQRTSVPMSAYEDRISIELDAAANTTKVFADSLTEKYSGGQSPASAWTIEVGPTNAVVKRGATELWSGAHGGGSGAWRIFMAATAYEGNQSTNEDFGAITVESV